MKTMGVTTVAAAAMLLLGCETGPGLAEVPPPPEDPGAYEPAEFEPVELREPGVAEQPPQYEPQPLPPQQPQAQAQPQAQPQAQTNGGQRTYTVQRGDTLWSIAQRQYGSGQRWTDIVEANPGLNPNRLPVGRSIILP